MDATTRDEICTLIARLQCLGVTRFEFDGLKLELRAIATAATDSEQAAPVDDDENLLFAHEGLV